MRTSDEIAAQREAVLTRIAVMMPAHTGRHVMLLQDVEALVLNNDEALVEVAALKGMRPSQGLFGAMAEILLRYPRRLTSSCRGVPSTQPRR